MKRAMAIALLCLTGACGGSGSDSTLSGNVSSATVESTTVDPSSQFTPTVTATVGSNGTLEFDSSPVDVNGDGTQDEVAISSVTISEYTASESAPLPDADAAKAVTYEFECRDTSSSSSISLLDEDVDALFPGKSSCTTDCGSTVRTRKINCAVVCEEFHEDKRLLGVLVLAAVASGYTYQSIINMVIFIALTC